jgi:hypothetical protein
LALGALARDDFGDDGNPERRPFAFLDWRRGTFEIAATQRSRERRRAVKPAAAQDRCSSALCLRNYDPPVAALHASLHRSEDSPGSDEAASPAAATASAAAASVPAATAAAAADDAAATASAARAERSIAGACAPGSASARLGAATAPGEAASVTGTADVATATPTVSEAVAAAATGDKEAPA